MRAVHSINYKTRPSLFGPAVSEDILIDLDESDLLPEELNVPAMYRVTLLQVRAEKQALLIKQRLGLLHKDKAKNDQIARERAAELEVLRTTILGMAKK